MYTRKAADGTCNTTPTPSKESWALNINPCLPAITAYPKDQTLCHGASLNLNIKATNAIAYQWKRNGRNILYATSAKYGISSASVSNAGTYSVTVKTNCSSATFGNIDVTVYEPFNPGSIESYGETIAGRTTSERTRRTGNKSTGTKPERTGRAKSAGRTAQKGKR